MVPLGEGVPTHEIFVVPMTSNFADICVKRSKIALFDKKCAGGGVPPAPTQKITIPSDFPYPHCLFIMTLLRRYGDV